MKLIVRDTKDSAQEKVLENQSDKAISSMG
jgi:hypothetical protein